MDSNLPPGVSVGDLPGNRPDDEAWDKFHEWVGEQAAAKGLSPDEAMEAWSRGLDQTRMTLDQWAQVINQWAAEKGWNEEMPSQGEWIALAHSELSEALEAHRDGIGVGMVYVDGKPEGVAVEYADCIIRILHWFARHDLSANDIVDAKMGYNDGRPYRHGGKAM